MVKTEEQRLTKQLLVLQKEEAFYQPSTWIEKFAL
jgi:hypothetical protein